MDAVLKRLTVPEFFNVWSIFSVSLFAANNYYLKYHYHNWITGKLSDVLLCFFLSLFISVILAIVTPWSLKRRILYGSLLTTIIYSLVKTSTTASDWLNAGLSFLTKGAGVGPSINIADPTDLIALPFIVISYWFALYMENK